MYLPFTAGLVAHGEEHGFHIASWRDPEMGLEAKPYPTASELVDSFFIAESTILENASEAVL